MNPSNIVELAKSLEIPDILEICDDPKFTQKVCGSPELWYQRFTRDFGGDISGDPHPEILYFQAYLNNLENQGWKLRHAYLDDPIYQRLDSEIVSTESLQQYLKDELNASLDKIFNQYISAAITEQIRIDYPNFLNLSIGDQAEAVLSITENSDFRDQYHQILNKASTKQILEDIEKKLNLYNKTFVDQKGFETQKNGIIREYSNVANRFRNKATNIRSKFKIPRTLRVFQIPWRVSYPPEESLILDVIKKYFNSYIPQNLDIIEIRLPDGKLMYSLFINEFIDVSPNLSDLLPDIQDYTGEPVTLADVTSKYAVYMAA